MLIERIKNIGLQWLEMRDRATVLPSPRAFCETFFPGPENAHALSECLAFICKLDEFDSAFRGFLEQDDDVPPKIPGYEFLDRIASGGMGIIWRATDESLQRVVAIKVMKSAARHLPQAMTDFQYEAKLTARLAHPNLVPVYERGITNDGKCYYVMKWIQGESLAQKLRSCDNAIKQRIEWLKIFSQVCHGVAFAHRQGIVHCDLKPENIMVGSQDEVQVMDWGLAREITSPPGTNDDRAKAISGTPGYMSPEQASGSGEIDCRSDVFSLGVILSTILTGDLPECFRNKELVDYQRSLQSEFKARRIDPRLSWIACQCVSADQNKRPTNAIELAAKLDDYLYGIERENQRRQLWRKLAIASLLFAALTAVGLIEYQKLWQSEYSARRAAEASRERTREILDEWSLNVVDPWLELRPDELTPARRELVQRMQTHYDQLLVVERQVPRVVFACAKGLRRIGQMRVINSDYAGAREPLSRSRDLVEGLLRGDSSHLDYRTELAMICHLQGAMFDSQSPPQYADALAAYDWAILQLRQLVAQSESTVYPRKLARSYISQAWVLRVLHEQSKGLATIDEAVNILEKLIATNANEWLPLEDLASALNIRYLLYSDMGQPDLAMQSLRSAIATRESLAKLQPDFQKNTIRLGINYGNFGKHLNVHNQTSQALQYYNLATAILEPIQRRNSDLPECCNALRNVYSRRAMYYEQAGSSAEAIRDWRSALSMEIESKRPILQARLALAENAPQLAFEIAEQLGQVEGLTGEQIFDVARIYSRVAAETGESTLVDQYQAKALKMLERAAATGYRLPSVNDPAVERDLGHLVQWQGWKAMVSP
jgi:tetratricopeptide (TPR) repeat protein